MVTLYQKIFTFCQRTSKSRSLMSLCTSTTAQNAIASSNQFRSCALGHPQHLLLLNLQPYKEQNCAGRQIQCRALSLDEHNYRTQGKTADTEHFTAVYRFQGIRFFRAISKFKLVQTGITIALLPPVYYFYLQGLVQCSLVSYITGLSGFAIVMLYSMSYYLRRFIGMLYLNDSGTMLMVSHLTFWGSRNDFYVPVKDVVPLGDTGDATSETILQFRRFNSTEVFYFTIKFGQVIDKQKFLQVFGCIQ